MSAPDAKLSLSRLRQLLRSGHCEGRRPYSLWAVRFPGKFTAETLVESCGEEGGDFCFVVEESNKNYLMVADSHPSRWLDAFTPAPPIRGVEVSSFNAARLLDEAIAARGVAKLRAWLSEENEVYNQPDPRAWQPGDPEENRPAPGWAWPKYDAKVDALPNVSLADVPLMKWRFTPSPKVG